MDKTFFIIAWRNIWRNKRRSILTISMIAFSLFLAILMETLSYGGHNQMLRNAIDLHMGSIQIHAQGYQENKTLSYIFQPDKKIFNYLSEDKRINAWTQRIVGEGLISFEDNTNGGMVIGIDPQNEAKVTLLEEKLINNQKYVPKGSKSKFLSQEPKHEAIIGYELARKLKIKVNDKIAVIVQGYDGSIGNELYTIVGVYNTLSDLDYAVNIHIQDAEVLFSTYGNISELVISVKNAEVITKVTKELSKKINDENYEILSWRELSPELVQYIELDSVSGYLFVLILLVIVAFGILNTIFISIMERMREFGILKALGTTPSQIVILILLETLFLTLIGVIIGNILGALGGYYFHVNPIDLTSMTQEMKEWGVAITSMRAEFSIFNFVIHSLVVFTLSMIAAIYPSLKAASFKPIEAIKHI